MLGIFLSVDEGDGRSRYKTAVSAELMYPPASRVGMHIATLEHAIAVVARVIGPGDRYALG